MYKVIIAIAVLFLLSGCADAVEYTNSGDKDIVGFWYGLWHGMIAIVAFIVSLFDESVSVYAVYNNGGWYNFGFLIGVLSIWGGGCKKMKCKVKTQDELKREQEWEEVGKKVEAKILKNLKEWVDEEELVQQDGEWKEVGEKVEIKLKRKLKEWAEKE